MKQREISKKILRRIAEHILAVNALYAAGNIGSEDGLSEEDIEYIQDYLEKMASKMTVGSLNLGTVSAIVHHWKSLIPTK